MSTGKIIAIIGGILLVAGGLWAALPLFYSKQVNEELPVGSSVENAAESTAPETAQVLSQGKFSGFDSVHQASGTAKLVQTGDKKYVRFENDFTVTNGPDLYVYFGKDGKYVADAKLGKLKGDVGAQNYEVPESIDPNTYNEVWVWCRAFSVPFGKAVLQ